MSVYLDTAATAMYKENDDIIIKTIVNAMKTYWKNPSSLYASSTKDKIDSCRKILAKSINSKSSEVYFCSSGSEANSFAISGFVKQCKKNSKIPIVITSTIEHKSIIKCVEDIDAEVHFVDVNKYGIINIEKLYELLEYVTQKNKDRSIEILVSIQYINGEIGTIQNIKEIATLTHKYKGVFHTDAVQAYPHIFIDVQDVSIDLMSVSAHKISPVLKGIGFLYIRDNVEISPIIYGNQENNMRGGTENTAYIIGMAKAVELLKNERSAKKDLTIITKRNYFISKLREFGCTVNGSLDNRLSNNINVTFPNITGEALVYMLDTAGIFISTGSACNSHSIEPSNTLKAIGLSDIEAIKTVRFTLSDDITEEQIDKVIDEIRKAIKIVGV